MNNELNQLVGFLTDTLKQGLTFAQDKIPDFVNQVIAYGQFKAWMGLGVSFFMVLFSIVALRYVVKMYPIKKSEGGYCFDISDWDFGFLLIIISVIFIIASIIMIPMCINTLVQIKIAPMMYLMNIISAIR